MRTFIQFVIHIHLPQQVCAFTYCYMRHTCSVIAFIYYYDPAPNPPDVSHLLGAHQEADHLVGVGVGGGGVDVGVRVGTGRAGGAVSGEAGQEVVRAVVPGQLAEMIQPPLAPQLKREQRLELASLDGAEQDHGVCGRKNETENFADVGERVFDHAIIRC